ncbi:MAG: hypothetical protein C0408_08585, partial [Odoribacter sp.]|nr:hypothetical protein [Odoribacter sp.]
MIFATSTLSLNGQLIRRDFNPPAPAKYVSVDTSTDPDEITLEPYYPGVAYSFTIPLINEANRPDTYFDIVPNSCSGVIIVMANQGEGLFTIPAAGCTPASLPASIVIDVNVLYDTESDPVKFIIPFSHSPVKVALVLDISGSMYSPSAGGTESRWSILKRAVLSFTQLFEEVQAPGDSGSLTYFTTDTVQPGAPIFKDFIPV